jgi:hypothetical protein
MSKLAALAAAGDSLTGAASLKAEALRVRDRRLAMMSAQARACLLLAVCAYYCEHQAPPASNLHGSFCTAVLSMASCKAVKVYGPSSSSRANIFHADAQHCCLMPLHGVLEKMSVFLQASVRQCCQSLPLAFQSQRRRVRRRRWGCRRRRATLRT